jgi:hypothetical protein
VIHKPHSHPTEPEYPADQSEASHLPHFHLTEPKDPVDPEGACNLPHSHLTEYENPVDSRIGELLTAFSPHST